MYGNTENKVLTQEEFDHMWEWYISNWPTEIDEIAKELSIPVILVESVVRLYYKCQSHLPTMISEASIQLSKIDHETIKAIRVELGERINNQLSEILELCKQNLRIRKENENGY
jgi:hypothetical protein